MKQNLCDHDVLKAYLDGELDDRACGLVEEHAVDCDACRSIIEDDLSGIAAAFKAAWSNVEVSDSVHLRVRSMAEEWKDRQDVSEESDGARRQGIWQGVSSASWMPTREFWLRVTQAAATLVEPLFPRAPAWQHASIEEPPVSARQSLIFDDSHAIGSFLRTGDQYEMRIEHDSWPAGSLTLLECVDAAGTIRLCRFYVLQEGWGRSAIEDLIEGVDLAGCMLRLRKIDTARLLDDEADSLRDAFLCAVKIDPDQLGCWTRWADSALTMRLAPAIRAVAELINTWPV